MLHIFVYLYSNYVYALNGLVQEGNRSDEMMGRYVVQDRNVEVHIIVYFSKGMEMAVIITYFKKKEKHSSGGPSAV